MILEVLKRTWREVRKERNEAKRAKEEIRILLKRVEITISAIDKAYESLSVIYQCLPEKDRQDYVQKTLDLLKFTGKGYYKPTAHSFYKKLCDDYFNDYDLALIHHYWKAKDWKNVVVVCERLKKNLYNSINVYKNDGKE
jgi:hypothetical protein